MKKVNSRTLKKTIVISASNNPLAAIEIKMTFNPLHLQRKTTFNLMKKTSDCLAKVKNNYLMLNH